MIVHCPMCERTHETTDSQVGQRVYCACGQWLLICRRTNGTHYAVAVNPPVSYPREKRT